MVKYEEKYLDMMKPNLKNIVIILFCHSFRLQAVSYFSLQNCWEHSGRDENTRELKKGGL